MVDVHSQIRPDAKPTSVLTLNDVRQLSRWSAFLMRPLLKAAALSSQILSCKIPSLKSLRSRQRLSLLRKYRDSVDRVVFTILAHSWKQAVESTRCHGTLRH